MKGLEEWGSRRRIDFLTPDTFLRKIIAVSTTASRDGSQTAITHFPGLNYFDLEDFPGQDKKWKTIKKHKTLKQGFAFHEKYVDSLKFKDCEKV